MEVDVKQIVAGVMTAIILSSLGFVFNNIDKFEETKYPSKIKGKIPLKDTYYMNKDDLDTITKITHRINDNNKSNTTRPQTSRGRSN